jgi:hypothetical protein
MMREKKLIFFIMSLAIFYCHLFADVPAAELHKPAIPYFGQSFDFQTVEMKIFSPFVSGMIAEKYSDLILNPAFIMLNEKKSFYLDFNENEASETETNLIIPLVEDDIYTSYNVVPRWYGYTTRSTVQMNPVYNFATILPLSSRVNIGFINRSILDYGPFRSSQSYYNWREESLNYTDSYANVEPKKIEVDENQQTVFGNQSALIIGMKVLPQLDLAVRLGYYTFTRDGNLHDDEWAVYPHSSYADLNDEELKIGGDHYETGVGALYQMNDKMRIGIYAGTIFGSGDEKTSVLDTSFYWSERETDTVYYAQRHDFLQKYDKFDTDSKMPGLSVAFQWNIKNNLLFRSFLSYSSYSNEFSGSNFSHDTSSSDRTYDYWISPDVYQFRRMQTEYLSKSSLSGKGKETTDRFRFFASFVYLPNGKWSLFSGIGLEQYVYQYTVHESSDYSSDSFTEYSIYAPGTIRNYYLEEKIYDLKSRKEEWHIILPVGIKAPIYKGLGLLVGTDLNLSVIDEKAEANLYYPVKLSRRWIDNNLPVETPDNDRLERYHSNPAKDFTHSFTNRFGLVYQHDSGARIYLKSSGDIFTTTNWIFGFELCL